MESLDKQERGKLWSIFQHMDKTAPVTNAALKDEVLIVDGLNTFIRSWSVSTTLNDDGIHTGGISGFLKSIGYAIKLFKPTRCVIVFDGAGGSLRRKKLYPEYKNKKSNKMRINRAYAGSITTDDEANSIKKQLFRVINYLDYLPVTTMSIDNIEADDAIAYLAIQYFKDVNSIIMSSDKDFLQLLSDRIKVWSPTRKKLYGCAEMLTEYGISCENFLNYRLIDGDMSDNISGIKGAGIKTIKKCFPIFADNHCYTLQEIYNYCETHRMKYKLYTTILENKDILERNYQLMQLNDTQIQSFSQLRINEIVDKQLNKLNRFEFSKLITEDKMWNNIPNYQIWLGEVFNRLDNLVK
jgi:5'-3' exonuclease